MAYSKHRENWLEQLNAIPYISPRSARVPVIRITTFSLPAPTMKTYLSVGLFSSLLLASSLGCNQSAPQPASTGAKGIAVIDLDEVAKQLGSDKKIASSLRQREEALKSKLQEMATAYTAQIKKHQQSMDGESEANTVQLAQYQQKASQTLNSAKAQAQQNLTKHRSQLVKQFRDAVRPAARSVAERRGLSVIVTKQDGLLYDFAPECDITSDVVQVLKAQTNPQPSEVEK